MVDPISDGYFKVLPMNGGIGDINFFILDFKGRHRGFPGILRLFRDLNRQGKYDYIIDLHDVLRSKIITFLFSLRGVPVLRIDKGRREKKGIIKGKRRDQLKHTVVRYIDVFEKAGFKIIPEKGPWIIPLVNSQAKTEDLIDNSELNIGIAPYAKHALKMWPEEYMIRLLALIGEQNKCRFFFFGGADELLRLKALQVKIKGSVLVSEKLNLEEEIALISRLSFMISMDSSNMHMAALTGTRVISIWGGTDPVTGFGAWQQHDEYAIRIPVKELSCRPCTVFGKGKCRRGDLACMNWLTPEKVFQMMINLRIFNLKI